MALYRSCLVSSTCPAASCIWDLAISLPLSEVLAICTSWVAGASLLPVSLAMSPGALLNGAWGSPESQDLLLWRGEEEGWGMEGQSRGLFRSKSWGRSSPVQLLLCKVKVLVSRFCLTLQPHGLLYDYIKGYITDSFFIGFYLLISNIFLYIFLI